jgi:hypothetical protein
MQLARSAIALDPRRFGRAPSREPAVPSVDRQRSDDLRLFAMTFAAGFLFVSVLIG